MKVKVSRTIDMSQIPTEARRMLDQAKNNLVYGLPERMNQAIMLSLSSQGEIFFQSIGSIDSLRQDLAHLDESLQEVQNILKGYKEAVMPSEDATSDKINQDWVDSQEAEYEKRLSQIDDIDEESEVENEEG